MPGEDGHMLTDRDVLALAAVVRALGGPRLVGDIEDTRRRLASLIDGADDRTVRLPPTGDFQLAYSLDHFAEAVDLSKEMIRLIINRDELVPSYAGTKPLIMRDEGERWLRSLPADRL